MKQARVYLLLATALALMAGRADAVTVTVSSSMNWSAITTGTGGGQPTTSDAVVVNGGATLTVDVTNGQCASVQLGGTTSGSGAGTLSFNSGSQVACTGAVTIGGGGSGRLGSINMSSGGTLVAASLALSTAGTWTPGAGTIQLTGTSTIPSTFFTSFNNLTLTAGTTTLAASIPINGTLTQSGGNLSAPSGDTLTINGTHNAGTNTVSGSGGYTLSSGATLASGHASGIAGNITTTTKTLNTAANYTFNGAAAQVTSATMPATVNNLTINNAAGVTLSQTTTVSGTLALTAGTLAVGANTLTLNGPAIAGAGNLTVGATGSLVFGGSASGVSIPSSVTQVANLTINNANGVALNGPLTVTGTLTLTSGALSNAGNLTLGSGATISRATNGSLDTAPNFAGNVNVTYSTGGVTTGPELPASTTALQALTVSAGTVTLSGDATVNGTFTIAASATFNDGGNTLTVKAGVANSGTAATSGGEILFAGSSAQTLSGAFASVELNNSAGTSLSGTTTISTSLAVDNPGTFSVGAFALTVNGETSIYGTLAITSTTGAKTFTDLTVNGGGTFNNSGNTAVTISGNLNNAGTFTAGSGVYTLSGASKNLVGTIAIPSITMTGSYVNNDALTVSTALSGAGSLSQGSGANLFIGGTSGITTLNATASPNSVTYNAAGAQTVKATAYNDLTLSGSGAKTMTGITTIGGDLTVTSSATMTGNAALNIAGAFNYGSSGSTTLTAATPISVGTFNQTAGTLIDNGNTITVTGTGAGVWVKSAGTFTASGTVAFTGPAPQIGAFAFNSLTINVGAGNTATLTGAASVSATGTLTLTSGLLASANNLTLASGATISVAAGNLDVAPVFGASVNVTYTGSTADTVGPEIPATSTVLNNLSINNTGGVTLTNNLTVNGALTIGSGATLDVSANNYSITANGNWVNNGGTFNSGSGTVSFNGSAAQAINGTSTSQTFNNLTIAKTAGQTLSVGGSTTSLTVNNLTQTTGNFTAPATLTINGNLLLSAGTFTAGANLHLAGNWTNNGATFNGATGTVTLNGTATQAIGGSSATTFTNLVLANTSSPLTLGANLTANGTFTVNNGATLNCATFTVSGAIFTLSSGATLGIGSTAGITASGATGNIQTTTRTFNTGANYTYNGTTAQVTGAGLPATVNNLTIDNSAGVSLSSSPTVSGTLNLNSGALTIGANTLTLNGAIANSGGSLTGGASANITFGGAGLSTTLPSVSLNNLIVNRANGIALGGAVTTTGTLTLTSGQITSAGSLTLGNNSTISRANGSLDAAPTFAGNVNVTYTVAGISTGPELPTSSSSLQALSFNAAGTVTLSANATANGTLTIATGVTLNDGGNTLTAKGTVSNSGTHTSGSGGEIMFAGSSAQNVAGTFGNLEMNNSAGTTTTGAMTNNGTLTVTAGTLTAGAFPLIVNGATTIASTLTISSATGAKTFSDLTVNGTFNNTAGNEALTISGSIANSGTFNAGTGVYTLTGGSKSLSGTLAIASTTINGTYTNNGTFTVATALSGSGSLTQGAGTTLNIGGTSGITTLNATASPNTVNYTGAGQTVKAVAYNSLTLSGSGAKTMTSVTTIGGDLTLSGSATMTGNAALNIAGALNYNSSGASTLTAATALTIGTFSQTAGTLIDSGNTINVTGTGASTWNKSGGSFTATGTASFTGAAPQIGPNGPNNFFNLTINVGSANTATLTGATTVAGTLNLTTGALANSTLLTLGNGATIARSGGTLGAAPTFGTWANVTYTGSTGLNAGPEMPSSATVLASLTINNSGGVTLSANVTVNTNLTLTSGSLMTSPYQINLANVSNASITGGSASSYVNGTLQKTFGTAGNPQTFTFPIGDGSSYTPINLASMTVGTAGTLTAVTTPGDHPALATSGINTSQSVNRYWTLTPGGAFAASGVSATFNFVSGDIDAGAASTAFFVRRYSGAAWAATTTGALTTTSSQATGLSAFGDFAIGENSTDHYLVAATSPQNSGVPFTTTVTAQDLFNQTVLNDSNTVVTLTGTGNVQFDSNADGVYGDNTKALSGGVLNINTKDDTAETVSLTATDGNGKTGTQATLVVNPGVGAYRSAATGNWSTAATWQTNNGASWFTATAAPGSGSGVITIQSGHNVSVTAAVTADQVILQSGGQLTVASGQTLTIANGAGVDLDVFGTVQNAGTITVNSGAQVVFESGGKYQHNYTTTAGTIPTATWVVGSDCQIIGYTTDTTAPAGLNQAFDHFTWNCPAQTSVVNLGTGLTAVNSDFTLADGSIALGTNVSVGGTCTVSNGAALTCGTFYVGGNAFVLSAGATLGIGDPNGIATAPAATGNIRTTSSSFDPGAIYIYNGTAAQVTGTALPGTINILTNANAAGLTLGASETVIGTVAVNSGALLNCSSSILSGSGSFVLASGGTLGIGDPNGIAASAASGNIQTSVRSFSSGANYTYNGSAAQITGDGLPATIANLTLNNAAGLTLTADATLNGTLTLTSGELATGGNQLYIANTSNSAISGGSAASYIFGGLRKAFATGAAQTFTFPIGDASNYTPLNLAAMTVTTTGSLTATTTGGDHPNIATSGLDSTLSVNRYWTLSPTSLAASAYNITANFVAGDVDAGANTSLFVVRRFNAGAWAPAATSARTAISTTATNLNAFGDIAIGDPLASNLAFTTQPLNTTAGATMANVVVQIQDLFGTNVAQSGAAITLTLNGTGTLSGTNPQTTDASGKATFNNLSINLISSKTLTASAAGLTSVNSSSFTINPAAATVVRVETAADGSGTVAPAQNITSGNAITVYSISRDGLGNFVSNVTATAWSLTNRTGGVVAGDLVGSGKNATFTAHVTGTAAILATSGALSTVPSGTLTVLPANATKMVVTLPGQTFVAGTGNSGSATAQTAGTPFNLIALTAADLNSNIATNYSGSQTINYTGPGGVPAFTTTVNFTAGQSTTVLATTLTKAETTTITATDGSLTGVASSSLTVNPAPFTHLQVLMPGEAAAPGTATGFTGAPTAQTAGTAFNATIRSVDAYFNLISTNDTVHITSSDSQAVLPANAQLNAGTTNLSVTFKTTASQTVTAADVTHATVAPDTGDATTVNPAAANKLVINTQPSSGATAGIQFVQQPVVFIEDQYNNVRSNDNLTITATRSGGAGTLSGTTNVAAVGGIATFSNLAHTYATNITIQFTSGALTPATSTSITVSPAAYLQLQVLLPGQTSAPTSANGFTGSPTVQTAGTAFTFKVNAVDAFWNIVTSDTDLVGISCTDTNVAVPGNAALVNGTNSFAITMKLPGTQTITASNLTDNVTLGTSSAFTVKAGVFAKLQVLMPGESAAPGTPTGKTGSATNQTAGVALSIIVNAVDANFNLINTNDTVSLTTTDPNDVLPANTALVAGTKSLTITNKTAGTWTATASDVTHTGITAGTGSSYTIDPAAFAKLQLLLPGESASPGSATGKTGTPTAEVAGTVFNATVNAVDAFWNLVNTITDNVGITSSDANAVLPASAPLSAGTGSFSVTLITAGSSTLTATDNTDGTKTANTSPTITVKPGPLAQLQVLLPGETAAPGTGTGKIGSPTAQAAGTGFSVTVRAVDANWNLVNTNDTVGITSTDPNSVAPANAALLAGSKTFTFTNRTVGSWTATASDVTHATVSAGTSASYTVNPGAFAKLQLLVPGETAAPGTPSGKTGTPDTQTVGVAFAVTANSVDANWNLIATNDTVHFTSTDALAQLPANGALAAGSQTFSVTLGSAGSSTLTASDATHAGIASSTSASISVNKGSQFITFNPLPDQPYGAAPVTLSASASSGLPVSFSIASGPATVSGSTLTITGAGAVDVLASQAGNANWNPATNVDQSFSVTAASLLVSADDQFRAYGMANPPLTVTYLGLVNGDTTNVLSGAPAVSTLADTNSPIGTYEIDISLGTLSNANYSFSFTNGTLTVTQAVLLVTADNQSRSYGAPNPPLTVTYSGFVNGEDTNLLSGAPNVSTLADVTSAVSNYDITVTQGTLSVSDTNYSLGFVNGTLTVTPAALSVTADSFSRIYGAANPTLTGTIVGIQNSDPITGSYSTTADPTTGVGNYDIVPALSGPLGNYSITTNNGTLTITAAPLSVTADNQSRPYGVANPTLTGTILGIVNNDPITASYTTTADQTAGVGTYPIIPTLAGPLGNYNVTTNNGVLTVSGAVLLVSADNLYRPYGATNPPLTVSYTGFVDGDNASVLSGSPALTTAADTNSPTGTYPIEIAVGSLSNTNYSFSFTNGTLTVTQAVLLVTADNQSRFYGAANPPFTASYSGFVNGEDTNLLSGAPDLTTTADTNSPIGNYDIVAAQGSLSVSDTNYSLAYANGILMVNPVALMVTADAQTKVYGDTDPALTYQLTSGALANGDTFSGALTRDGGETIGSYAIRQGTLSAGTNYTLAYVGANLTITSRPVTVTADTQTRAYGDSDPALTYQVTAGSLVSGDSFGGALTRDSGENVGTYAIQQGSLTAGTNYALTYIGANLGITARPITVTADTQSKVYGDSDPALTYQVTTGNLVGSDAFTGALTRTAGENAGTYPILQGTLTTGSNYQLTYQGANLTIGQHSLLAQADNLSRPYGATNPVLTITYTGFVGADGVTNLMQLPVAMTDATTNSPIGQYDIVLSGGADTNYSLVLSNGTLTVATIALTVTADAQTKVYGDSDPALTYQITSGSLLSGDSLSGALTRDAGETIGAYGIQEGTLAAGTNYTLTYVGANLTITPRPITITADTQTKVYGDTDPALTYQLSSGSLLNGDSFSGALTRDAGDNVGSYAINQGTLTAGTNYGLTYNGASLSITARPIAVTADAKSKTYGDADPALTYQLTGGNLIGGDALTGALTRTTGENVGSYAILQGTLGASANYQLTYNGANLTIGQRSLLAQADNLSRPYGATNPVLTVTYTGFVGADGATNLMQLPVATTDATTNSPTGQFDIVVSGGADTNYSLVLSNGTLTVTQAVLLVSADNQSRFYGSANPPLTANYSGFVNGQDTNLLSGAPDLSTTADTNSPVGSYDIVAAQGSLSVSDTNYSLAFANGTLTVNPLALTLTADSQAKGYGDTDPTLTYQLTSGALVNGDSLSGALTRDAGEAIGTYAILQGTLSAGTNYTLAYVGANLTITTRPITVTADTQTKVYGDSDPALTYQVTAGSLLSGDSFSGALTRDTGENVGTYAIQPGNLTAGTNYALTYIGANLGITARPITVTADAKSKTYGDGDPALTHQLTSGNLVGSDAFSGALARVAGENAGSYAILQGTLGASANYQLTYNGANLTISQRSLLAQADNLSRGYGTTNPVLTITYTGFIGADGVTNLMQLPVAMTDATTNSPIGQYDIVLSGGADTNYSLVLSNGTLTVSQAILLVTADNQSRFYGSPNPTLTATFSGFVNGQDTNLLSGAPALSTTADTNSPIGSYDIVAAQGSLSVSDTNYSLAFANGTLTVNPLALTVTTDPQTKAYGDADPTLTYEFTSGALVNGDSLTGALSRDPGETIGTYAIRQGTLNAGTNYTLAYVGANLTITTRAITVTADPQTKVYGDSDPALTYQVTAGSLLSGDSFSGALTRDGGENVGSYAINQSTLSAGTNYALTYLGANLTITARPLTVTADAKSKTYGDGDPALTYQLTSGNLVGSDAISGALARVAGENAGSYAILQGTLSASSNYQLTYAGANLTISQRSLLAQADNLSRGYGTTNPVLTITYTGFIGADGVTNLMQLPLAMTDATTNSPIGQYDIVLSSGADTNYSLVLSNGTLTVTAVALTVTADSQSKAYGDSDPALTYQITSGSLLSGDSLTGALSRDAGETIGSYAIRQGTLAAGTNYTLTYIGTNLTITTRPITVTADAQTKVYGDSDPALSYQITTGSLASGDSFSGALTRDSGEDVGAYAIHQGSLSAGTNYALAYQGANLTISTRPVTVTADAKSKTYGDADPALTYQLTSGSLVNGGDLSGSLTRDPGEDAGAYAIRQGTLAATANYALTFVGSTLTISPAASAGSVTSSANPALPGTNVTFTMTVNSGAQGTVNFRIDGVIGGSGALSGGVATYSTSTLTHGSHTVAAEYAGSQDFIGATNALAPAQVINTPPVAGPATIERFPSQGTKVSLATLLTNATDADGDALSLSVSTNSPNGATITVTNGWAFYTPANGFTNTDSFTYTVTDAFGATATGTVTVAIEADNQPGANLTITAVGDGTVRIDGSGIPNRSYQMQYTDSLTPANWQSFSNGNITADGNGVFQFTDTVAGPARFYRSAQ